jgi:ribonucleoside-diphosphate reductase alpha chain
MDNSLTNGSKDGIKKLLNELREVAVKTNIEYAEKLGIERSASITCVKPSGTVSQLVDSASGIHARHNPYYIRTVRADNKDPLCKMMKAKGFPNEPDVTKPEHTSVFSFPAKSPKGAICRGDMTAWKQLSLWHTYAKEWCEHKPSVTVSVKEDEWVNTSAWVYDNFDDISGISFLPFSDHTYKQAPYQDCTEKEYKELLNKMPKKVDWSSLADYETQDYTSASQEFACTSEKGCEIVDISPQVTL